MADRAPAIAAFLSTMDARRYHDDEEYRHVFRQSLMLGFPGMTPDEYRRAALIDFELTKVDLIAAAIEGEKPA